LDGGRRSGLAGASQQHRANILTDDGAEVFVMSDTNRLISNLMEVARRYAKLDKIAREMLSIAEDAIDDDGCNPDLIRQIRGARSFLEETK
jgi:hypothetical protein